MLYSFAKTLPGPLCLAGFSLGVITNNLGSAVGKRGTLQADYGVTEPGPHHCDTDKYGPT